MRMKEQKATWLLLSYPLEGEIRCAVESHHETTVVYHTVITTLADSNVLVAVIGSLLNY